jgi:hypothetical protein
MTYQKWPEIRRPSKFEKFKSSAKDFGVTLIFGVGFLVVSSAVVAGLVAIILTIWY